MRTTSFLIHRVYWGTCTIKGPEKALSLCITDVQKYWGCRRDHVWPDPRRVIRLFCWLESFSKVLLTLLILLVYLPFLALPVLLGDVSRDMIDDAAPRTADDMKPATNFSPRSLRSVAYRPRVKKSLFLYWNLLRRCR